MKNTIRLAIVHPEKTRVEHFLNHVNADLEPIPFDKQELRGTDEIIAGFQFRAKNLPVSIIVIFATSYSHATEIEAANLHAGSDIEWTINGEILFGVESIDEDLSGEILSLFAGRE